MQHRALTKLLHLTLFSPTAFTSCHLFPWPRASSSTVRFQVFFSLPLLLLPWGFQSKASFSVIPDGLRSVWPIQDNFLLKEIGDIYKGTQDMQANTSASVLLEVLRVRHRDVSNAVSPICLLRCPRWLFRYKRSTLICWHDTSFLRCTVVVMLQTCSCGCIAGRGSPCFVTAGFSTFVFRCSSCIRLLCQCTSIFFLNLLLTANGVIPCGSGTTITQINTRHTNNTQYSIHNTQNYKYNKAYILHTLKNTKWVFKPNKERTVDESALITI